MKTTLLTADIAECQVSFNINFIKEFNARQNEQLEVVDVNLSSVDEIRKKCSQSDILIILSYILYLSRFSNENKFLLTADRKRDFYKTILEVISTSSACKIFYTYSHDLHHTYLKTGRKYFEDFFSNVDAIAWPYEKEPVSWEVIPEQYRDEWMNSSVKNYDDPKKNWEWLRAVSPVRIEVPYALASHEFLPHQVSYHWDACVAGAPYNTRRMAQNSILEAGLSLAPYHQLDQLFGGIANIDQSWGKHFHIHLRRMTQKFCVSHSKVNFVCGSGIKYPIFKFFEIPALNSVLLAYPCNGFEDFGFKDGVNCIITTPEDAGKDANRIINNNNLSESIKQNAMQLMYDQHTICKRVSDFIKCCTLVYKGKLKSAQFKNGQYIIDTNA